MTVPEIEEDEEFGFEIALKVCDLPCQRVNQPNAAASPSSGVWLVFMPKLTSLI